MKDCGSIPLRSTSVPKRNEICQLSLSTPSAASVLTSPSCSAGSCARELSCADCPRFVRFCAIRDVGDQYAKMVADPEKQGNQFGVEAQFVTAHFIQHAFRDMGESNDMVETKQAGRTLDGVGGTKNSVDRVRIVGRLFDAQQRLFHVLQQFAGFDDESIESIVEIHGIILVKFRDGSARGRRNSWIGRTTRLSRGPPDCSR